MYVLLKSLIAVAQERNQLVDITPEFPDHVLPKNGYKKTAVKCSVFTTVCFVFNSILGVTTQGKL